MIYFRTLKNKNFIVIYLLNKEMEKIEIQDFPPLSPLKPFVDWEKVKKFLHYLSPFWKFSRFVHHHLLQKRTTTTKRKIFLIHQYYQYLICRGDASPHRELASPHRDLASPHRDLASPIKI